MGFKAPPAPTVESPLRRHVVWLLVSLAYLYVFPFYERLNNPNENARVWMTRAIVEYRTLYVDRVEREWGWVNDKATSGKHVYSGKAPGASFLGVPILYTQTKLRHMMGWPSPNKLQTVFWLRLLAVEVPLCIFLWFFARYVERTSGSPVARDLLVAGLGLGTLLYPYGVIFVGHSLAAIMAFASYMLLGPPRRAGPAPATSPSLLSPTPPDYPRTAALVGAGLCGGLCVVFEYQAAFVAVALAVYVWSRFGRRTLAFIAGAVPPAIALGAYHTALFGRPWKFPFGNVENPEFARTAHAAGFHGLSIPHFPAIGNFLFSADYGLFVFSPILALGAACTLLALVRGPRREALLTTAICVLMFLFLAGMSNWRAGWCVGPRYIATVAPFLIAAIARAWPATPAPLGFSALVAGLVIPSVALNGISGALYPHYPTQFNNPVFDLALPLLRDGFLPYSLGRLLHLPGLWSLAPLALVVLAAVALGTVGGERHALRRGARAAIAVAIAAVCLVPLSRYGRRPSPGEAQATAIVHQTWEPPPHSRRK